MQKLEGCRVLLVEDEFLIALELRMVLEDEGAEIVEADSVEDGLQAVDACAKDGSLPDVAVLDVRLGDEEVFPVADDLTDGASPSSSTLAMLRPTTSPSATHSQACYRSPRRPNG